MLSLDTAVRRQPDLESDARRVVAEMIANGAQFTVTRREDGTPSFLWQIPGAGNRSACRRIIADAKTQSAVYWRSFVAAIVELTGAPVR